MAMAPTCCNIIHHDRRKDIADDNMGNNITGHIFNRKRIHPKFCSSLKQIYSAKGYGKSLSTMIKETHNVQSPINLGAIYCVICDGCDPLHLHNYFGNRGDGAIINTGQTVKISLPNRLQPFIRGGPLNNDYLFDSLHFHWSNSDIDGTEHTVDGQRYSMECHLVHYNSRYSSVEEAVKHADGLAVLGFFIQAYGDIDSKEFQEIVNGVTNVTNVGAVGTIGGDCLAWLQLQELQKHYFTYRGSLTTEPYNESVTWIVFRTPIYVSERQVSAFRNLQKSPDLSRTLNNIRPLQTPPSEHKVFFVRSTKYASKL